MQLTRPHFTAAAMRAGVKVTSPLLIGTIPFGIVMGVTAQGHGLSMAEAALMSAFVYAGSAQLLALAHWGVPAPIVGAAITAFVVNLRLALMGPVIAPWLDRLRGWRLWGSLFLMADQNWALSVTQLQAGRWDAGFLFGSGLAMWVTWLATTVLGFAVGSAMQPAPGHPLFFAALAVFVCILVTMWKGRGDLLPWAVAAVVAMLVQRLLPDASWHILAGALSGAAAGVLRDRVRQDRADA